MATLHLCLHRSTGLISRIVRGWTGGRFSHASILLPDGTHVEAREWRGVLWHPTFTPGPQDEVDLYPIEASPAQIMLITTMAQREVGAPYDWTAILCFILHWRKRRPAKHSWTCSEFCYALLQHAGFTLFPNTAAHDVSPSDLARLPILTDDSESA